MGQTILCELIAQWEESGEQPDVTQYEFTDMLDVLVQARDVMFELGTQYNELKAKMKRDHYLPPGVSAPPEPFDWEWLGYCQYPVFDSSVPEYESDCREPAIARGWWEHDEDGWLLCQGHLDKILEKQEEQEQ